VNAQTLALKNKSFASFFTGSLISFFGSGLHLVAATWYIHSVTESSWSVALLWFSMMASSPILLIYSGAIIDRFNRQKLLAMLSVARGIVVLSIPISIYAGTFSLWQLYIMAFINGIGFNISFPTEKALVQELMSENDLLSANSLVEISIQVGMFASAVLAGVFYAKIGLSGILLIDSITFLTAASFFNKIKIGTKKTSKSDDGGYFASVKVGWKYLFHRPNVLTFCVVAFVPTAVTLAYNVVMPAYVDGVLGKGVISYGALDGFYGLGAFLSGVISALLAKFSRGASAAFLIISSFLLLALLPNITWLSIALLVNVLFGYSNTSLRIIFSTMLMEIVPNDLMGRVSSASLLASNIFQFASFFIAGYLIDHFSLQLGCYYLASLMLIVLLGMFSVGKSLNFFKKPKGTKKSA